MPKRITQCPKLLKKFMTFFCKKNSSLKSYLNVECYRFSPVENFSRRVQRFFGQCLKVFKKLEFVLKKKTISIWMLLWICWLHFSQSHRQFFVKSPKKFCSRSSLIKIIFFSKTNSIDIVVWTQSMQFSQPRV